MPVLRIIENNSFTSAATRQKIFCDWLIHTHKTKDCEKWYSRQIFKFRSFVFRVEKIVAVLIVDFQVRYMCRVLTFWILM